MRIELKACSLEDQRIIKDHGCYMELNDDHLRLVIKFLANEPINPSDPDQGWDNIQSDFTVVALKKHIAGCEKVLCRNEPPRWRVMIMIMGFPQDLRFYFKKESEADDLFTAIQKYILS